MNRDRAFLVGGAVVLPDRLLDPGTVVIDGNRIVEVSSGGGDLSGHVIVPGFIDVHVHGIEGDDALDGTQAIARMAARLPRFGVTAFCPTSIACPPVELAAMLEGIHAARARPVPGSARVLPAHLESNFINAEFKGAQPVACIRAPRETRRGQFSGPDILAVIAAARADVGIITVAPEIDGVLDLIPELVRNGHRVSLGHSGATYEQAIAGIAAGARHATHLFNRMTPLGHRTPGLTGAVLERDELAAEIICDGVHVHPAAIRAAVAAKGASRMMAITDGTAGSGLPRGTRTALGGRPITVGDAAYLDDGTLAGSVLTMDRAFATLVKGIGFNLVDASLMCSTTPARELGLSGLGEIAPGAVADLVVLDAGLRVAATYVGGEERRPEHSRL